MSTPSTKFVMRCSACGSDHILRDAWATWDFMQQVWVLDQIFDHTFCERCEGDCSIDALAASSSGSSEAISNSET